MKITIDTEDVKMLEIAIIKTANELDNTDAFQRGLATGLHMAVSKFNDNIFYKYWNEIMSEVYDENGYIIK